jgi:Glu-tRNA(Gln) amidotransferase subunit E-like FAD-binding protein
MDPSPFEQRLVELANHECLERLNSEAIDDFIDNIPDDRYEEITKKLDLLTKFIRGKNLHELKTLLDNAKRAHFQSRVPELAPKQ